MSSDLTRFLVARLDEDEAIARAAYCAGPTRQQPFLPPAGTWWPTAEVMDHLGAGTYADASHITRHDPARVLREVELHRAVLGQHWTAADWGPGNWPRDLLLLAAIWSDHPDYRPEWKLSAERGSS